MTTVTVVVVVAVVVVGFVWSSFGPSVSNSNIPCGGGTSIIIYYLFQVRMYTVEPMDRKKSGLAMHGRQKTSSILPGTNNTACCNFVL